MKRKIFFLGMLAIMLASVLNLTAQNLIRHTNCLPLGDARQDAHSAGCANNGEWDVIQYSTAGGPWTMLPANYDNNAAGQPAGATANDCEYGSFLSCNAAFNAGQTTDGVYNIDVDGVGTTYGITPMYCDMVTGQGGWTLVMKGVGGSVPTCWSTTATCSGTSASYTTTTMNTNGTFKMSDNIINIIGQTLRLTSTGTYNNTRYWCLSSTVLYAHRTVLIGGTTNRRNNSYSDVGCTSGRKGGNDGGDLGISDYDGTGLFFGTMPDNGNYWLIDNGSGWSGIGTSTNVNFLMWVK